MFDIDETLNDESFVKVDRKVLAALLLSISNKETISDRVFYELNKALLESLLQE